MVRDRKVLIQSSRLIEIRDCTLVLSESCIDESEIEED